MNKTTIRFGASDETSRKIENATSVVLVIDGESIAIDIDFITIQPDDTYEL